MNQRHSLANIRKLLLESADGIVSEEVRSNKFNGKKQEKEYKPRAEYKGKTRLMLEIEKLLGRQMEDMLAVDKPGYEIAEELDISEGTVAQWRRRLGIEVPVVTYRKHNRNKDG